MALNIKDPETDRLARELAALTGQPITSAVREAIEARLAVLRRRRDVGSATDLLAIIHRGRARATVDTRAEEEILGYDDRGLPA